MQSNSSKIKTIRTKPPKQVQAVRGKTWERKEKESKQHKEG